MSVMTKPNSIKDAEARLRNAESELAAYYRCVAKGLMLSSRMELRNVKQRVAKAEDDMLDKTVSWIEGGMSAK